MRGFFVAGVAHGAREQDAGEALVGLLRAAGEPARTHAAVAPAAAASPLTSARHAGQEIDPQQLLARARAAGQDAAVAVTAGGGLLAPLTPRYTVRDLARELGLPVVLATAPGPDAVNLVRLSADAARAAGLSVAAVVLAGWPEPPSRAQLDERRLLEELAGLPVATLPADASRRAEELRRWPDPLAWLDAAPVATPVAAPDEPEEFPLDPYQAWEARPLGDPRGTPRPAIMAGLLEIVEAEGPILAYRAYSLYNKAAGGKKLTSIARAPLSSAAYWLAREQKILLLGQDEIPWQGDEVLRAPDTPAVRVRALGPRPLEEVPLDEIAELMRRIRDGYGVSGEAGLKRAALDVYGLKRLTARADEYLGLAYGLLEG